ncbi:MAG: hypothetical protein AAF495_24645 [Pseudomonadota bacterium]
MEDMELWTVTSAQLIALASLLAVTLGTLRKRNVLPAESMTEAFRTAESYLPEGARPVGANLLAHMRMIAEVTARGTDKDPPHGT